jgi:hypothetical protein
MKRLVMGTLSLFALSACRDTSDSIVAPTPDATLDQQSDVGASALPHRWAVVDQNGTLTRGSAVSSVTKLGIGQYEVTFTSDVSQCAYIATTQNAYSQALGIFTAGGHLSANGVFVETKNQGGGLTDGPFHLAVTCGDTGIPFAVIGYSANLVRATPGTTMTFLGAGRYRVTFPSSVAGCAYVATVADPGNALVFSPQAVYTASGPNASTVYVETKNPGGGLQDGTPFHLAVVCPSAPLSRFAVVRVNGTLARGSVGTTSTRNQLGRYAVSANRSLNTCATVVTRGSVGTGVPFNPATVETLPGATANKMRIQVRELLFFGGNFTDQAFHTASLC